jgi:hypothetical protein
MHFVPCEKSAGRWGWHAGAVDVTAELDAPCPTDALFAWVDDLGRYPAWLAIVERAEPDASGTEEHPAWLVELRGRIGPLARSKRLRMVRTQCRPGELAVFERQEHDGRSHSPWVLRAEVADADNGSQLVMRLHYGGSLWGPVLERLLGDEIGNSRQRLLDQIAAGADG